MTRKRKPASNIIKLDDECLYIELRGLNKLWGLKSRLKIPLTHVRGATIDTGVLVDFAWKVGGYHTPNKWVGHFARHGEKLFYNIEKPELPVVITLEDEKFDRLILGVEQPRELVDQLNNFDK